MAKKLYPLIHNLFINKSQRAFSLRILQFYWIIKTSLSILKDFHLATINPDFHIEFLLVLILENVQKWAFHWHKLFTPYFKQIAHHL